MTLKMKEENIMIMFSEKDSHNNRSRKKKGEGTKGSRGQTKIQQVKRSGEGVYC